jgi:hypothetical protein
MAGDPSDKPDELAPADNAGTDPEQINVLAIFQRIERLESKIEHLNLPMALPSL